MNQKIVPAVILAVLLPSLSAEEFPSFKGAANSPSVISPGAKNLPVIDGILNDSCWKSAGKVSGFLRMKTTRASEEQTTVAVNHTEKGLLVAAVVADKKIVGKERKRDQGTWEDDCFELFLDPLRARQDRFHFIISAAGMIYDARMRKGVWNSKPEIKFATRQWPGIGWTVEMAIPFKTLETGTPRRGDVWDLKLAREDYDNLGGVFKLSSWQPSGADFSDASAFGRLVFEHPNRSWNGDFSKGMFEGNWPACGWRTSRQSKGGSFTIDRQTGRTDKTCGSVKVDRYTQVQHCVPVIPFRRYRLTAWVNVDGLAGKSQVEVYTERNTKVKANPKQQGWQKLVTFDASGPRKFLALTFTSYYGPGRYLIDDVSVEEIDNVPRSADSICYTGNAAGEQARHNRQVEGRYTYLELASRAPFFPQPYERGTGDVEEHSGWIPFAKGHLTDGKPSFIQYHHWTKSPGKTLLFDLGDDRFITDLEIEPVIRKLRSLDIHLKLEKEQRYTLVSRPKVTGGSAQVKDINAHARFVRIDHDGESGLREIRIWGKDIKGSVPPRAFAVPVTIEEAVGGPALAPRRFGIFPTPKELKIGEDSCHLKGPVRVSIRAGAEPGVRAIAEDLAERLELAAGLSVTVEADQKNAQIRLRVTHGADGKKHHGKEGYELKVNSEGAEIAGGGLDGLFYGCQTLLQCVQRDEENFSIRSVEIRDWPSYSFRAVQAWGKQVQVPSTMSAIKVLARMKMDHILLMGNDSQVLKAARELIKLRMESVPRCADMPGAGWYSQSIEMYPGEIPKDLPSRARINPCPSHPLTHKAIERQIGLISSFPGKYAYINCDEMYQEHKGARWNVCKRCQARKLSGDEVFLELLTRIHTGLRKIGKTPVMLDTMYCVPYKRMNEAFKKLPKEIPIIIWHPKVQAGLQRLGFSVGEFMDGDRWSIDETAGNVIGGYIPSDGGFKLEKCVVFAEAFWSGKYPDLNDPQVLRRISDVMLQVQEAQLSAALPSRRASRDQFVTIALSSAANTALADETPGDGRGLFDLGRGTDLSFLEGNHILNGVPLKIGGRDGHDIVVIDNHGALDPRFPSEIQIEIGRRAASLVFLHTLTRPMPWTYSAQLTYAGTYLIEYEDGTRTAFPIRYKQNILEANSLSARSVGYKSSLVTLPAASPAWRGNLVSGESLLLLTAEWVNPFPEKTVRAIRLRSTSRMFGTRIALFAATAVQPTKRDIKFWSVKNRQALPPEPKRVDWTRFKEIDLTRGKFDSDIHYTAPDGTTISASAIYTLKGGTIISTMKTGYVTVDNNLGWQVIGNKPGTLTVTFPGPRTIDGISLLGLPETPEYVFVNSPAPMNYAVEVLEEGKAWTQLIAGKDYLPDRDGETRHVFPSVAAKALRITIRPTSRKTCLVRGIARLKIYERGAE